MVAEGTAHIYPKLGKTMEWDTAAGHAILKAVGRNIFHPDLKTELTYNKEDLQNPHFIAL
jgi:3'(2'), 5'-bisphosphate nucleotidase